MSKEDDKPAGPGSSEPARSTTSTLAPAPGAADVKSPDQDHEKQESEPPQVPEAPFPEGGLRAWAAVIGAWLVAFATSGYMNTFGAYQSYYHSTGYPTEPSSNISWIGSLQLCLQLALGPIAGALYDRGYFRHLLYSGSVIYVVCLFMTSLAKEYWQTMLAQGVGIGIGSGLMFLPCVSCVSQFFLKRRSFVLGLATTGASIEGVCFPIMLNKLIALHEFSKAVQYNAYLILGIVLLACALIHPRFVPSSLRSGPAKTPSPAELFISKSYTFLVIGTVFVAFGLFFPSFYIQVHARDQNLPPNITNYLLAILNGGSAVGRVFPNFIADYLGSLNLLIVMGTGSGILAFSVFGANTSAGSVVVAVLYGFFSGGYQSLVGPTLISMATHPSEIGMRLGVGFLAISFPALTGTPITGALLDRYGLYAPIVWSGVTILVESLFFVASSVSQKKLKGTWKV